MTATMTNQHSSFLARRSHEHAVLDAMIKREHFGNGELSAEALGIQSGKGQEFYPTGFVS